MPNKGTLAQPSHLQRLSPHQLPSTISRHGENSSQELGSGCKQKLHLAKASHHQFSHYKGVLLKQIINNNKKEHLRLSELNLKKPKQSCSQSHTQKNQPTPTCARNSKMTIYIKLTNKVHVPYITPAPCVKATPQVLGKKSQPRAQDHIVL